MEWHDQTRRERRPQLGLAVAVGLALTGVGWAAGLLSFGPSAQSGARSQDVGAAEALASGPPPEAIEDCNRQAALAKRDPGRVMGEAVVGGAIGDGAGKGAGIGALVGATAGTLHGLTAESAPTEGARAAYRECMASRGYSG